MDVILSKQVVFRTPSRAANVLNKGLQNECFAGKITKLFTKTIFFFEMLLMDGCSKNSSNLFYKTPMDASG